MLGEVNRARLVPLTRSAVRRRIEPTTASGASWICAGGSPTGATSAERHTLIASNMGGQMADLLGQAADSTGGVVFGDTNGMWPSAP